MVAPHCVTDKGIEFFMVPDEDKRHRLTFPHLQRDSKKTKSVLFSMEPFPGKVSINIGHNMRPPETEVTLYQGGKKVRARAHLMRVGEKYFDHDDPERNPPAWRRVDRRQILQAAVDGKVPNELISQDDFLPHAAKSVAHFEVYLATNLRSPAAKEQRIQELLGR